MERYNTKQTRKDRRIDDYYEKTLSGKQEQPFHEIIIQIGNRDDMGQQQRTESWQRRCWMNICRDSRNEIRC